MSGSTIQLKMLWWVGPLTIASAIAGVLIVRLMARLVLQPPYGPGLEVVRQPVMLTLILCTGTVIVFALVGRFAKNPVRTYIIISSIFLVISFIPDIMIASAHFPGAGWVYSITLMIIHVVAVAGFTTVYMLIKLTTSSN